MIRFLRDFEEGLRVFNASGDDHPCEFAANVRYCLVTFLLDEELVRVRELLHLALL